MPDQDVCNIILCSWDWGYRIQLSVALTIRFNLAKFSYRVRLLCLHHWRMLQLRIDNVLRDIKGLSGELSQKAYLASWMGHFGTETIQSLFDRFSLSKRGSTLNLTNTLFLVALTKCAHARMFDDSHNRALMAIVEDKEIKRHLSHTKPIVQ